MVAELMVHARRTPSLPQVKRIDVARLAAARKRLDRPPSWQAIFMKAQGLVAREFPELRRSYMPWPRPHLYEHPFSIAAVLVERDWQGERVVLGARIKEPEARPLEWIQGQLQFFASAPVWDVNYFRQILRVGRLPAPLRRFTFWQTLYLSGFTRAKRFGTFMLSSLGKFGVETVHPLTPLTTYLAFGSIGEGKSVRTTLIYDHRVMDGSTTARCLCELEETLNGALLDELSAMESPRAAA
jgi:hypothetical protein